jgi:transposase
MTTEELAIDTRYKLLEPFLNEQNTRLWAASEAKSLGRGGIAKVKRATGIARNTIVQGLSDLKMIPDPEQGKKRIRKPGGGRKKAIDKDPRLKEDLDTLIEPVTRGDPESPLRWTSKSLRVLAGELEISGHKVSRNIVAELLHEMGYSLQTNRKTFEGKQNPDRNAQFEYLNAEVRLQLEKGNPVISVDTKKKELVGNFKNGGREWQPKGKPEEVNVYDFPSLAQGKVNPYGVYDVRRDEAWVNVGVDKDTAEFAIESIRRWWKNCGSLQYENASELLITADSGGSNGSRVRLWKVGLQKLANKLGILIKMRHFPPGTSKWNKIEHKLFSFISMNWRGRPLTSYAVILELIGATTNKSGLKVSCELDLNQYPRGIKVTDKEMAALSLEHDDFHGEWNYQVSPMKDQTIS